MIKHAQTNACRWEETCLEKQKAGDRRIVDSIPSTLQFRPRRRRIIETRISKSAGNHGLWIFEEFPSRHVSHCGQIRIAAARFSREDNHYPANREHGTVHSRPSSRQGSVIQRATSRVERMDLINNAAMINDDKECKVLRQIAFPSFVDTRCLAIAWKIRNEGISRFSKRIHRFVSRAVLRWKRSGTADCVSATTLRDAYGRCFCNVRRSCVYSVWRHPGSTSHCRRHPIEPNAPYWNLSRWILKSPYRAATKTTR